MYEKMYYLSLVLTLFVSLSTTINIPSEDVATHIDVVEEYVEATVKDMLGYYELDKSELGTLEEGLALFPHFMVVYEHVDIYAAILSEYQEEFDEASKKGNWTEEQKIFVAYSLACCSSIVEGEAQYGYELLENPDVISLYWSNGPEVIKKRIVEKKWSISPETSSQNKIRSIIRSAFKPLAQN